MWELYILVDTSGIERNSRRRRERIEVWERTAAGIFTDLCGLFWSPLSQQSSRGAAQTPTSCDLTFNYTPFHGTDLYTRINILQYSCCYILQARVNAKNRDGCRCLTVAYILSAGSLEQTMESIVFIINQNHTSGRVTLVSLLPPGGQTAEHIF